jgi:hypothetical protein
MLEGTATAAAPAAAGTSTAARGRLGELPPVALVATVAFLLRLVPVLRGGGLFGRVSYDGSVYYGAAAGLARGLLPYRDFLLLHPPGVVLVLLPFAELGRMLGDARGMAVARVAFMLLGALNAVLVSRILRPQGPRAALVGGLFYAVFLPAVLIERTTTLEAVATLCLLASLWLLTRTARAPAPGSAAVLLAGILLGVAAGVKIWGVVVALAVVVWCVRALGIRAAALAAAGAGLGASVVCVPFFLAAPGGMWRMVVLDQLGRPRSPKTLTTRLVDLTGLSGLPWPSGARTLQDLVVAAALVLLIGCGLLALRTAVGRLAVTVLAACVVLLLATPSWFMHYAGLTAAPAALMVGAVATSGSLQPAHRWRNRVVAAAMGAVLVGSGLVVATQSFGMPFPGRTLAAGVAADAGCVTTDDPTVLIESDLLRRNLERGCPLVLDLGGYSYDLPTDNGIPSLTRASDRAWQRYALAYLRSGVVAVNVRFRRGVGFSPRTAWTIDQWPVLGRAGRYPLLRPLPRHAGAS